MSRILCNFVCTLFLYKCSLIENCYAKETFSGRGGRVAGRKAGYWGGGGGGNKLVIWIWGKQGFPPTKLSPGVFVDSSVFLVEFFFVLAEVVLSGYT